MQTGIIYQIISLNSNSVIAEGQTTEEDTIESIIEETKQYVRRNVTFPVKLVFGKALDLWTNEQES